MVNVVVRVNGRDVDAVSTLDRGLAYGDGVFETLRITHGAPQHWPLHRERLMRGCARLRIASVDLALIERDVVALSAGIERAVLKVMVTRGVGGRGYRPPDVDACSPTHIVQRHPLPDHPSSNGSHGITVRLCDHRLPHHPALSGIKHLNRLDQVLARAEWHDPTIAEGLLLDDRDVVISGTMSNVFFMQDGALHTPDVAAAGIAGITRSRILDWAQARGMPILVGRFGVAALRAAEEVFVCNSIIGVWPVVRLEAHSWPLGPVARAVSGALFPP